MKIRRKRLRRDSFISSEGSRPRRAGRGATLLAAVVALTTLSGCTGFREYVGNGFKVGPNYRQPAASVEPEWLDANDPTLDTTQIQPDWWQTFNDPVLESLILSAYRQNLTLRAAGCRIMEARAQRAIAAGNLFPQGQQIFGDYARIGLSENSPSGMSPSLFFDDWDAGASLAWEIDFWGRFRRAVEAADANLDASVHNYDDVLVILLSDVAKAYSDVRIAEQRLAFAKQNLDIQKGSLHLADERFRNGATTRLDVTQGLSNVAQTEANLRPLEAARRMAVNQLCILMGTPPQNIDAILAGHQGIPAAPPQVAVGIPADLLRRRPDVRRAEREVAAQSAMIGVAVSELYPHFSIYGTVMVDATRFSDLLDTKSFAGSVGPSFQWNILNYGRLKNNVCVQQARFWQLALRYQDTVLRANAEAENALVGFLKAQQQVRSLTKSADAARESVDLVMVQYREGVVDFNRVFNVQQFLTQQQDQLAVAQGSVAQYLIQLYRALGGGWQFRCDNPRNQPTIATPGRPNELVPLPKTGDLPAAPMPTPAPKKKA